MNNFEHHAALLVVDPDDFQRRAIAASLGSLGYEVVTAGTGERAIHVVQENTIDLVLLNLRLPDFDGFEVLRRFGLSHGRVPVIFLSAVDDDEVKLRGFALGGDDFITKPFGIKDLVARVRAVLHRTRPGDY